MSQAYVSCPKICADQEEVVRRWLSTGHNVRAINIVGEAALRSAIADVLPQFLKVDGTYRLDYEFMYLVATA